MQNLTLAITTVGNLLLNGIISVGDADGQKVTLRVPVYQRPYKWSARNAIQLLDDIVGAKNGNKERYRIGTLILHHDDEKNVHNIVDGLQRVITFCLLLKALEDEGAGDVRPIDFLNQELPANEHNRHNIANNFRALKRRVAKLDKAGLKEFVEKRCELIVVITSDVSEAFQFFDSQNARGKALYPHDLLKAYHLREMDVESADTVEKLVNKWEKSPQDKLANLFSCYLYRIKEWSVGKKASGLNESNIHMFKGLTRGDRTSHAQFYKGAYSYADMVNKSAMPFVSGTRDVNAFQINAPVIAGRPFFEYTWHYYSILKDIQDNSKYQGFYINGNEIVKTLDKYFMSGKGNGIARLLFDTSVLLYVDRFCPASFPTKEELDLFDHFVNDYAFVWAYSLRAQYSSLGWQSAENYIMGRSGKVNSFNMYKLICEHDSPESLLSELADRIGPVRSMIHTVRGVGRDDMDNDNVYKNYQHFLDGGK